MQDFLVKPAEAFARVLVTVHDEAGGTAVLDERTVLGDMMARLDEEITSAGLCWQRCG